MVVRPSKNTIGTPQTFIDKNFVDLRANAGDANFFKTRAILASKHVHVDAINESVLKHFPGDSHTYFSFDSVVDDNNNLLP